MSLQVNGWTQSWNYRNACVSYRVCRPGRIFSCILESNQLLLYICHCWVDSVTLNSCACRLSCKSSAVEVSDLLHCASLCVWCIITETLSVVQIVLALLVRSRILRSQGHLFPQITTANATNVLSCNILPPLSISCALCLRAGVAHCWWVMIMNSHPGIGAPCQFLGANPFNVKLP